MNDTGHMLQGNIMYKYLTIIETGEAQELLANLCSKDCILYTVLYTVGMYLIHCRNVFNTL